MGKYFLKATEDKLSDAFQTRFESAKDGLKNAFSRYIETVLPDLKLNCALEDILDRSIEIGHDPLFYWM